MPWLLWLVGLGGLGGAGLGLRRFWRLIAVGAAYKAKALCSALFVSKLDLEPNSADEVSADHYRAMRLFRAEVDRERQAVSVSCLGLRPRVAVHRPGYGATLVLGPLGHLPAPAPPRPPSWDWDAAPVESLTRLAEEAFPEPEASRKRRTRAVLVARGRKLLAEHYAPGFSAQTPLPGWSMTKSVIGALTGVLIKEKRLALTDRALLPAWEKDKRSEIRLEDLLRMRSGLSFIEDYGDPSSTVVQMLFTQPDAGAFAAAQPLEAEPGTEWKYSSGTTNILSGILRRRLGEAYAHFPRKALFDPLGMASAVMEPDASGAFIGSSFMLATARDWARFGRLHLDDESGLLPEGWSRFCASPTPQSENGKYGAHWWRLLNPELGGDSAAARKIPGDAFHALGHEGQCLTVIPSRDLVIVRLGLSIYIDAWNHAEFVARVLELLD